MEKHNVEFKVGKNKYTIETGEIALYSNGAVLINCNDVSILVSACASKKPRAGIDFFPLMVDYEERMYSIGKVPANFIRREGKPFESSVLTSRLIDRPIRPLFPDGYRNDVQVAATLLSSDQQTPADVVAINGASAALAISDIPFDGPIAGVRVGRIKNKWIANPNYEQIKESSINLVIAGTDDAINMVEASVNLLNEEMLISAIEFGHKEIKKVIKSINELVKKVGKEKQKDFPVSEPDKTLKNYINQKFLKKFTEAFEAGNEDRKSAVKVVEEEVIEHLENLGEKTKNKKIYNENPKAAYTVINQIKKKIVREKVTTKKIRVDGRKPDEIRQISSRTGLLKRTHGSALFTRGTTQVISTATLGSMYDLQRFDEVNPANERTYLHHYNFPGYSVGEVKPNRFVSRREVGHGELARKALLPVLPDEKDFPYVIRVVSEAVSSNGSTSMASTCGSTMALMDAGVPIKKMVGGVAMGLIKEGDEHTILTDILGEEDHLGDMDFKVTGTLTGVTALQMDMKISGISMDLLKEALEQARKGRIHIIRKMMETIKEPKKELSMYAPRIFSIKVDEGKIGDIIGPGGKVIKQIVASTGAKVDIDDEGIVQIVAVDPESARQAKETIERLTKEVEVGEVYNGKITRINSFGAFVELYPGQEGMIHISQLSEKRVRNVEDVVKIGQDFMVKVAEIDSQGRVNLTRGTVSDNGNNSEKVEETATEKEVEKVEVKEVEKVVEEKPKRAPRKTAAKKETKEVESEKVEELAKS